MTELPMLERRKVHAIGDGGLAVLLPKKWARDRGLEKGEDVIVVANNRIIIEPVKEDRIEEFQELIEKFVKEGLDG